MSPCKHKNTKIWEPHLAGARKCLDCGWVKSPNRQHAGGELWFDEDAENEAAERTQYERLKKKYEPISEADSDRLAFIKKQAELGRGPVTMSDVSWLIAEVESMKSATNTLYNAIKHGDQEHRAWLKEAIDCHFSRRPIPPPTGKGTSDVEASSKGEP